MPEHDFLVREFRNANGTLAYRFLPNPTDQPQPLVLFLHGAGERGTDNAAQLKHVVGMFADPEVRRRFPCQVVAPQCPPNRRWVECDWNRLQHDMPESPSEPMSLLLALLDERAADPLVDSDRIYVMGLSMGGYGTWDLIARQPERFAAAVPICGGGDEQQAGRLVRIPIWAFHGSDDSVVPVARSRNMVAAVRAAGGTIRYTEYAGTGHGSWTPASREPELLTWLFGQARGKEA
jgi:predicted peptidase